MSQSLMRTRRFFPLFVTQFLGAFNDNFFKNALIILIAFKSASVFGIPPQQMVILSGGIFILPFFLFSATSGQLADKYEKNGIIRWIKLAEIAFMVIAAYGFMTHHFELLILVLFLMGVHSTFFGPIKYSILPQLVRSDELVNATAQVGAGTFLAILLGTIAGGSLIALESGPLLVGIGLIAVAAIGFFSSLGIPRTPAAAPEITVQWNPVPPTIEVVRESKKVRAVFLSVLGISWFWFFGAAILSLLPSYCKDVLKSNAGVATLFLACFSIGIGIGSMLCSKFSKDRLELGLVPLGSIGMTVFAADLFFAGVPSFTAGFRLGGVGSLDLLTHLSGIRVVLDLVMLSIFSGFYIVPLNTLIQERAEPAYRSRIIASNNILNSLFMVATAIVLTGLTTLGLTIPQLFLFLAAANVVVAIYIYTLLPEFFLRFLAWGITRVMYRLTTVGSENIPATGPAVLVCNHVSWVDWLIVSAAVSRPLRFIMDHNYTRGPISGPLLRGAKVIPIAPAKESAEVLEAAFKKIADELRAGEIVCLFPEGKITWDGNLSPFKAGLERIVQETPVPVIPMALQGLWGSYFSRHGGGAIKKIPNRFWSRIGLVIGKPIAPAQATAASLQEMVRALRGDRG